MSCITATSMHGQEVGVLIDETLRAVVSPLHAGAQRSSSSAKQGGGSGGAAQALEEVLEEVLLAMAYGESDDEEGGAGAGAAGAMGAGSSGSGGGAEQVGMKQRVYRSGSARAVHEVCGSAWWMRGGCIPCADRGQAI